MDYIKPTEVIKTMIQAGATKAGIPIKDLLIRGFLSGAILGFATSLAINISLQTTPAVGALLFPVGFVIIVLLGLELVTGSFALLPLAVLERKTTTSRVMANFAWVFLGNLLGSLVYAGLLWISLSMAGQMAAGALGDKIAAIAVAKTTAYAAHGGAGMLTVFIKAVLCNWMVCLGVVMAMTSSSTIGKIAASWLPIFIFFAQGYEHAVVNMFVIPAGIFFGAKVSLADWWIWNQIPVTLGNLCGGLLFTGLALYATYKPSAVKEPLVAKTSAPLPEEATA